jgi:type I restriction enzyme, R subunit
MKFTEEKLEKAFTELLGQEGFPHHLGITIARKPDEVLIEEDLRSFLLSQYAKQGITTNEVNSIILQLKSLPASDLIRKQQNIFKNAFRRFYFETGRPQPKRHLHSAHQLCRD